MNEICSDQNDDEILHFEVCDAFLEGSAGGGRDNTNAVTHGVCTAVDFCVGALMVFLEDFREFLSVRPVCAEKQLGRPADLLDQMTHAARF